MKEPVKEPISATVPARAMAPIGSVLVLEFGQSDPSAPSAIPATPVARPESLSASVDNLPVYASNPPPTGKGKASKKPVRTATTATPRELSPEQVTARRRVSDCWYDEFKKARGEKPSFDGKNLNECKRLLEKFDWNADRVCEIIGNAFRQKTFVEFKCKLSEILNNTTQYQGTPTTTRLNLSTSQMPTGKKDYGC